MRGLAGPTTTFAFGTEGAAGAGAGAGDVVTAWSAARDAGVRIHAHALGSQAVSTLGSQGEIRDDVTFVHGGGLDDAALGAIASGGASISLTPSSEMAGGAGAPPIQELLDHDLKPALGVDDERIGPGDLFAQMRATISLQHATVFDRKLIGKAGLPRLMTTRDVIRSATVEGARAAGQQGVTGSLEPGMQADLIVLRTDRPNVFPINDPIGAVVWGMDTSNVDLVIAGGRVLVRGGRLETDVARVRALATAARERVLGVTVGAVSGGAS
jgi:5-methylthioadenosine/S-adenosylhomocysteine deaminase